MIFRGFYKTTKFYSKWLVCNFGQKHAIKFNISKNLLRKVGISNSLCSRTVKFTIFKRQIKARGTHTPNPWSAFLAHIVGELPCGSQSTAPTCCVELALKELASARKGHWSTSMSCWWDPVRAKQLFMAATARVLMAVRIREVMEHVCPLLTLMVTRTPPSPRMSW